MDNIHYFANLAADFFLLLLGTITLAILVTIVIFYIIDRKQHTHTVRRNFPVIGRFRYVFEHIGEFLRQYFFAMDREELPFNRAQRSWVYRAAKNIDTTIAFGSTKSMDLPGDFIFANSAFPTLKQNSMQNADLVFGKGFVKHPYQTNSIINISGMSYGALSKKAVTALSKGAEKAGIWMNTGEGGLSPYHQKSNADIVFQIGTAKYGVRDLNGNLDLEKLKEVSNIEQVKMFEIKLSQGAKPGKGGMLPGNKVNAEIAKIRNIPINEDSISPNRHNDIENNEQLLEKIYLIRQTTNKPVGIKFVLGDRHWLDELFKLINEKGHEYAPDFITLDSADGGTGAAPQPLMDFMGLPLQISLPLLTNKLSEYQLRDRIYVIASGKLITPSKIAWALCMGADAINSARGFMFALGCIQALQCNKNTCPTGITTHNKKLQRGIVIKEKSQRVCDYALNINKEIQMMARSCGLKEPRQFKRKHCLEVLHDGSTRSLAEIHDQRIS